MYKIEKLSDSLIFGESFEILQKIPSNTIDLIYADPPFKSESIQYGTKNNTLVNKHELEILQYSDYWGSSDIYLTNLINILIECHRVLKNTGSIYLHCDDKALKYLWHVMDSIFGEKNWRDTIIWHYSKINNAQNSYAHNHDYILFYTKTNKYTFNPQYLDIGSALRSRFRNFLTNNKLLWKDAKKKKQQLLDSYIKTAKKVLGRELVDDDIIIDFDIKGMKKVDSVWEITPLTGRKNERTGFPTQKPEKLLERIIKASSNPRDIVLDPFCGSGTTTYVANKLNRIPITIDFTLGSIAITKKRCIFLNIINISGNEMQDYDDILHNIEKTKEWSWQYFEKFICKMEGAKHLGGPNEPDGNTPNQVLIDAKHYTVGTVHIKEIDKMVRYLRSRPLSNTGVIVAYEFSKGLDKHIKNIKDTLGYDIILKSVYEYGLDKSNEQFIELIEYESKQITFF